jgi:DnaJ-class molecular chaperone
MALILEESEEKALVRCAYCRGTGRDRFAIMSALSTCAICAGKREIWLRKPLATCAYCQGVGVSPIGARNPCLACRGKGVATIEEPKERCRSCGGTGIHEATGLYCLPCHGKGIVALHEGVSP